MGLATAVCTGFLSLKTVEPGLGMHLMWRLCGHLLLQEISICIGIDEILIGQSHELIYLIDI